MGRYLSYITEEAWEKPLVRFPDDDGDMVSVYQLARDSYPGHELTFAVCRSLEPRRFTYHSRDEAPSFPR